MKIIAVGAPKGGVGKSTISVTLATICAMAGLKVLLVDGDGNRSSWDWAGQGGEAIPVDLHATGDPEVLRQLRAAGGYELMVVDLPGARPGAFEAILAGDGRPVPDLLLVPTSADTLDLRPTMRMVRSEVMPLGLDYRLVLSKIPTSGLRHARQQRDLIVAADAGYRFAETIVRAYTAYPEAVADNVTVVSLPGRHSRARLAEQDSRALAAETLAAVGIDADVTGGSDRG